MTSLSARLTVSEIAALAGPSYYARGLGYHAEGRVQITDREDASVTAVVRGTEPYRVELRLENGRVRSSCSCPLGVDLLFCKHCVAVALAAAEGDAPSPSAPPPVTAEIPAEPVDLASYLDTLDQSDLVDLVLERSTGDWRFRDRLTAVAASRQGTAIAGGDWSARIEAVLLPGDFVDYREAPGWAEEVHEVLAALDELVDAGQAEAVIPLAEEAYRLAEAAVQFVDDSDGWIMGFIDQITRTHLRACTIVRPAPLALAQRLVDLELGSEYGGFTRAAATYAHVLLLEGLAEYRRLVEPRWEAAKADSAADDFSRDYLLRQAMAGIAEGLQDPDELIAVLGAEPRPDDYIEIAEALRGADRMDEAIDWARRGHESIADRPWQAGPTREVYAELLRETDDPDAAVALFWSDFEARPSVTAYRRLIEEVVGTESRSSWTERALTMVQDRLAAEAGESGASSTGSPLRQSATSPADALVQILLFEDHPDKAWEAAQQHGCSDRVWLELAQAREREHPADAIPIYERAALAGIGLVKRQGYQSAVRHLEHIRLLAVAAGDPARFDRVVTDIRADHKRKTSLMAMLDAKGW